MRGDGRKFRRGEIWWVDYYAPGPNGTPERVRESTGSTRERDADALLKERGREVGNHREGLRRFSSPAVSRVTMGDLFDDVEADYKRRNLKSLRGAQNHMRRPRLHLAAHPAVSVTAAVIDAYIDDRKAERLSDATIDRETEFIRRAFTLGMEKGRVAFRPHVPKLVKKGTNARQGFLDRADFDAILALVEDEDFRDALSWFFWTGMRPGEICSLTWAAHDKTSKVFRLASRDAKTGRPRLIPLVGPLAEIIERRVLRRTPKTPLVFHSLGRTMGATSGGEANGWQTRLWKMWREAAEKAGHAGLVPYDLRRTAVRNLIRAGVPQAVAKAITGHVTDETFHRYNIVDERDVASAIERVAAWQAAEPTTAAVVAFPGTNGHRTGTKTRTLLKK